MRRSLSSWVVLLAACGRPDAGETPEGLWFADELAGLPGPAGRSCLAVDLPSEGIFSARAPVGGVGRASIAVRNTCASDLAVLGASFDGDEAAFEIVGLPSSLPADAVASLEVDFAPSSDGLDLAVLVLRTDDAAAPALGLELVGLTGEALRGLGPTLAANAGPDLSAATGAPVALDGTASVGATSYAWGQRRRPVGSTAVLGAASTSIAGFTPDVQGLYSFRLVVSNGAAFASDTAELSASPTGVNQPPIAVIAGAAQRTARVGVPLPLDGTPSTDDGVAAPLRYRWGLFSAPVGARPTWSSRTSAVVDFTPDLPGDYQIGLLVWDGLVWSTAATVEVSASDTPVDTGPAVGLDARPANPTCLAPPDRFEEELPAVTWQRVWPSLSFNQPVGLYQAPGDSAHWYVIEQGGRIKRFDGTLASPTVTTVSTFGGNLATGGNEQGLLGLAFHPDFANNGQVFLNYTTPTGTLAGGETVIARVQTSNNGATWPAFSAHEVMIRLPQPATNHNAGHLEFGPDGLLYASLGDGGGAASANLNPAQDPSSLLGKLLRIDVDGGSPYGIPADNMFVGIAGRDETYAMGLRNPWRFTIDDLTGEIWVGDVGQDAQEEVDLVEAGGNYGWNCREGGRQHRAASCVPGVRYLDPEVFYTHDVGAAVTAGVVYRGSALPGLVGSLIFADYMTGVLMAIRYDAEGEPYIETLGDAPHLVAHFTTEPSGEVLYLDRGQGAGTGDIWRLVPTAPAPPADIPRTLSATGCFDALDPSQPVDALIPYSLNHPFWSDGAEKSRWFAIPDGATVDVDADGELVFPPGSVLAKEFRVGGQRVETRLFMHHATDGWAGYTYKWRADGSDADLLAAAEDVEVGGQTWSIPSRQACMRCHTEAAGFALGPEIDQLDREQLWPSGVTAGQLHTLEHIGWFTAPPPAGVPFPAVDDAGAPLDERARAYLHVNCSSCHRPGGPTSAALDLRFGTSLSSTGMCAAPQLGSFGIANARVVAAGDPARSVLSFRMAQDGAYRMPPIGVNEVDTGGLAVIDAWIASLGSCP